MSGDFSRRDLERERERFDLKTYHLVDKAPFNDIAYRLTSYRLDLPRDRDLFERFDLDLDRLERFDLERERDRCFFDLERERERLWRRSRLRDLRRRLRLPLRDERRR